MTQPLTSGWTTAGLVEVTLPSGYRVKGVLPMLHTLLRADLLPTHLLEVALRGADPKWLAESTTDEDRAAKVREYMDVMIASFPRYVQAPDSEEWEPVTVKPENLPDMPQDDVDALEDIVFRLRTPEQLNAGEGRVDPAEFREQRQRIAIGADLSDLVDAPEHAAAGG